MTRIPLRVALVAAAIVFALPGSAVAVPIVRDLQTSPAEFVAYGSAGGSPGDRLGLSLAMGDINSDGRADVMSGAPLDERPGDTDFNRGGLHVYFGAPGFSGSRDSSQPGSPDLIIYGEQGVTNQGNNNGDALGKSVAVGDVNGDGKNDLVVGAVRADLSPTDRDFGKIYVFYQHTHTPWPSLIDLRTNPGSADVVIYGDVKSGDFGIHVAVGDFDGDGFADVLGGAAADTQPFEPGGFRVVYGAGNLPSVIDLRSPPIGVRTLFVNGETNGDKLGHGVATGDVNGDGIDDVIGGAPSGGGPCPNHVGNVGNAYVFYGHSVAPPVGTRNASTADLIVRSPETDDQMGRRLEAGDVNGNGVDDLILGARCTDGPGGRTDSGAVHVLFGPLGTGTRNLATNPANATIFGVNAGDQLGIGPGSGDLNGDGVGDLIAGADEGDGPQNNRTGAGETAVLFGPLPSGVRDLATSPADLTVHSPDGGDRLGRFVAAADVDGDGAEDLGVTAYFADGPNNATGDQTGEFNVLTGLGGPAPSPSPSPTASPSPSPSPSPTGSPGCTITGTSGDDVIKGTNADDVICALGGNDKVSGKGGNDSIFGDAGNDDLRGDSGNDTINGGAGADSLVGGDGDDSLDTVDQVAGNDTMDGGAGTDSCQGDIGDNAVNCEGGPTPTPSPSPSPSPSSTPSDCTITGTSGNDILNGGAGDDVICGLGGDDKIKGNDGSDTLRGDEGNDTINSEDGVVGNDSIDGGPGTDTCKPRDAGDVVTNCEDL